jgi:hypothetical protein
MPTKRAVLSTGVARLETMSIGWARTRPVLAFGLLAGRLCGIGPGWDRDGGPGFKAASRAEGATACRHDLMLSAWVAVEETDKGAGQSASFCIKK